MCVYSGMPQSQGGPPQHSYSSGSSASGYPGYGGELKKIIFQMTQWLDRVYIYPSVHFLVLFGSLY